MEITMYNVEFGDCFVINDNNNLVVDFGIHPDCLKFSSTNRKSIHQDISLDLYKLSSPELLLTHYHQDHYSGLLYMMSNFQKRRFKNMYIPDVWDVGQGRDTVTLLLLEDLMKDAYIYDSSNQKKESLLTLAEFICGKTNVIPVKKGSFMCGTKYKVLWPDTKKIFSHANELMNGIEDKYNNSKKALSILSGIAVRLIECVNFINSDGSVSVEIKELWVELNKFNQENKDLLDDLKEEYEPILNYFGNEISVVFHNSESRKDKVGRPNNILFTGDIPAKYMQDIMDNGDLYTFTKDDGYKVIKIPHHGTQGFSNNLYYFDFTSICDPQIVLIPNGNNGNPACKITSSYLSLCNNRNVYCSNCNFCNNFNYNKTPKCQCGYKTNKIVYHTKVIKFSI